MSDPVQKNDDAGRAAARIRRGMWLDKGLVILSMGLLIGFCGIIVYYVAEPDLAIIMTACLALVAHDFWTSVLRKKPGAGTRK